MDKIASSTQSIPALLEQAGILCEREGATLLFLTMFGSSLYGTRVEGQSDIDLRGIFLPSIESAALLDAKNSLHLSTADNSVRNCSKDVDIDLWSLQYWLLQLLPRGDTGAIDMLFAPSNPACTLFRNPIMDKIFSNPLKLLNTTDFSACINYIMGQARRYGIKGSRAGVLKNIIAWLSRHCPNPDYQDRLEDYMPNLAAECGQGDLCSIRERNGQRCLLVCDKLYTPRMRMSEFSNHIKGRFERVGTHAMEAMKNQGLDYKALSHAIRALDQMEELITQGRVTYPLASRHDLIAIKKGTYSWRELEPRILKKIEEIKELSANPAHRGAYDRNFARKFILDCYGIEKEE